MLSRLALLATAAGIAGNINPALAISIPFTKSSSANTPSFTISTSSKADSDDPFEFGNVNSIQGSDIYVASIKVSGQDFQVRNDHFNARIAIPLTSRSLRFNWILVALISGSTLLAVA